jgi:hypothetical protein
MLFFYKIRLYTIFVGKRKFPLVSTYTGMMGSGEWSVVRGGMWNH